MTCLINAYSLETETWNVYFGNVSIKYFEKTLPGEEDNIFIMWLDNFQVFKFFEILYVL